MLELIKLTTFFFVLFDPLASLTVFYLATKRMSVYERNKIAFFAVAAAAILSFGTLILGENLLTIFNTDIDNFRIAGGIILILLGIRVVLGYPLTNDLSKGRGQAIASIIATPLLTGPAVMSALIVVRHDYGLSIVALAVSIVLVITWLVFHNAHFAYEKIGGKITQVLSTFLGLVTVAWGVNFLRVALGF